jgi:hypothetical protein
MKKLVFHPVFVPFVFNLGRVVLAWDFHFLVFYGVFTVLRFNEAAKIGKYTLLEENIPEETTGSNLLERSDPVDS